MGRTYYVVALPVAYDVAPFEYVVIGFDLLNATDNHNSHAHLISNPFFFFIIVRKFFFLIY